MSSSRTSLLAIALVSSLVAGCTIGGYRVRTPWTRDGSGGEECFCADSLSRRPPQRSAKSLGQLEHEMRRLNAEVHAAIAELQASVDALAERMELQRQDIVALRREIMRSWEGGSTAARPSAGYAIVDLDSLGGGSTAGGESISNGGGSRPESALTPDASTSPPVPAGETGLPEPPPEGRRLYETAYQDFKRENYQLALLNFRAFLERYPRTSLSDNAIYWIGTIHYERGKYRLAVEELSRLIEEFPDGNKVPAAYFKIGQCFEALGERETSRRYYEYVVNHFPDSREAFLAEERLRQM